MKGIVKPGRPAKSNADRQADFVAKRSELGAIPPPADPARRAACEFDLLRFGLTYAQGDGEGYLLDHEPSEKMYPYIFAVQDSHLKGQMVHPRFPRGKGKTTWMKIGDIWAASYGHSKFMVDCAANQDNANAILDDVWDFLEECEPYGSDFPEIAIPVRSLDGRMQRCPVQTVNGVRTKIKRGEDRIVFPRIEGYPCSGVRLVARGRTTGIRGIVKGKQRPDHFGIDDPQNDESARSPTVTADIIKFIHKSVLGLCGHNKRAGAVLTTTPIEAGDLSDLCADSELYPQWTTISIPLVIRWPDRTDLWDEYLELCRRDKIKGLPTFPNATAHYKRNRKEMDRGAEVLDPKDGDPETELSALQHAYNLLFIVGRDSFDAEYMLTPPRGDATFELSAKVVAGNLSLTERLVMPAGFHAAVASIDCMAKDALRWKIVAIGSQRRACIVAYGRYPEKGMLYPSDSTTTHQNKAFSLALGNLINMLGDTPIQSEKGPVNVCAIAPDRGWKPRIVEFVCTRSKHKGILYPSLGYASRKYAPERTDGKSRTNVLGVRDHCYLAQGKGFRYLGFHSDYWKEYAQRSFLAPALTPGSTAIYGTDPLEHYDLGCEICAEILTDKGFGTNGTEYWTWTPKPNAKNHGLDEITQALMLASWVGVYDAKQTTAGPGGKKPKKGFARKSRLKIIRRA